LLTLEDEQRELSTPAEGWTVKDSVSHVAQIDEVAVTPIRGDNTPLDEATKLGLSYADIGAKRGRAMQPARILR